ncbi:MAG: hypothetical protein A2275_10130 [Bacteroidetes bacterium RIFOXYA12_FULL_35_11]|nr:MAG: hypothetical protein A2X01_07520 [Bacteroidetes bacterium GWF2_35_48]OFY73697.1 MAG: hypothetical protein A2275_10130 [Bacteroidetes bacterium RIFOXYA12_FULL_35_11]OFY92785.1 MAG: hypothetical protein A2491_05795 [Bacteroidetes bacterium RIFOXYC12_FULL_35_7]HBX52903.1 DUF2442 domain-containing protein [Bacteroidales bacterium]
MGLFKDNITVDIDDNYLYLVIDNITYNFELKKISQRLYNANISDKKKFVLSPSKYGIHWFAIDEDLSISALLKMQTDI